MITRRTSIFVATLVACAIAAPAVADPVTVRTEHRRIAAGTTTFNEPEWGSEETIYVDWSAEGDLASASARIEVFSYCMEPTVLDFPGLKHSVKCRIIELDGTFELDSSDGGETLTAHLTAPATEACSGLDIEFVGENGRSSAVRPEASTTDDGVRLTADRNLTSHDLRWVGEPSVCGYDLFRSHSVGSLHVSDSDWTYIETDL